MNSNLSTSILYYTKFNYVILTKANLESAILLEAIF